MIVSKLHEGKGAREGLTKRLKGLAVLRQRRNFSDGASRKEDEPWPRTNPSGTRAECNDRRAASALVGGLKRGGNLGWALAKLHNAPQGTHGKGCPRGVVPHQEGSDATQASARCNLDPSGARMGDESHRVSQRRDLVRRVGTPAKN